MPERLLEPAELIATPRAHVLPASGRAGLVVVLGAVLVGFVAQWGSVVLWIPPTRLSTVWLPGSVMLAIALLAKPRRWLVLLPAGGAGQALLFISMDLVPPTTALVLGTMSTLATAITAGILLRVLRGPLALWTFREFLTYLGIVVVGGSLIASTAFMLGARWLLYRPATFLVWRTFTLSAVLGYLMVTPLILLLVRTWDEVRRDSPARRIEAATIGILLMMASSFIFGPAAARDAFWPLYATIIPPLLLWAALRFTALGASAALLLVTAMSTFGTARGRGPFTSETPGENTVSLQLFMLGTGLPLIGLAVVLEEQRRTVSALMTTHGRLRELHRDLLTAREEEGTRIARELHDDVGQRLALVSIGLSRLRRSFRDPESQPAGDVGRLQEQTSSIARSLRELSRQLHPAALEHAGLAAALQMQCDEVARVTGLDIRLGSEGTTTGLPEDIALCLYRVAQEALTNVVRHAEAHRVDLTLHQGETSISLRISDDGRGLPPGRPGAWSGLGLHSANERVRLLGGTLGVESTKGAGTTIRANVPLPRVGNA